MIVRVPTVRRRDELIQAVADAVAALRSMPRLAVRDIRVLDSPPEPRLAVVIRFHDASASGEAIRSETDALVREYVRRFDLSGMSVFPPHLP